MEITSGVIEQLEKISSQLNILIELETDRKRGRDTYRKHKIKEAANTPDISKTLEAAFKDCDRIRRQDLYAMEIHAAKEEHRQPIRKGLFYKVVEKSGHGIIKSNGEFYFIK